MPICHETLFFVEPCISIAHEASEEKVQVWKHILGEDDDEML